MFAILVLRNATQRDMLDKIKTPLFYSEATDENGISVPMTFKRSPDAFAKIKEIEKSDYQVSENENGRPEYLVLSFEKAQSILSIENDDHPWHELDVNSCLDHQESDGEFFEPCQSCMFCEEFMIENKRACLKEHAIPTLLVDRLLKLGAKPWHSPDEKISRIYLNQDLVDTIFNEDLSKGYSPVLIGSAVLFVDMNNAIMFSDTGMVRAAFNGMSNATGIRCASVDKKSKKGS